MNRFDADPNGQSRAGAAASCWLSASETPAVHGEQGEQGGQLQGSGG